MDKYKKNKLKRVESKVEDWLDLKSGNHHNHDASLRRMDAYNRKMAIYMRPLSWDEFRRNSVKAGLKDLLLDFWKSLTEVVTFKFDGSSRGLDEKLLDLHNNIYKYSTGGYGVHDINRDHDAVMNTFVDCYDAFYFYHLTDYMDYLADKKISALRDNNYDDLASVNNEIKEIRESLIEERIVAEKRKAHYGGIIKTANELLDSNIVESAIECKNRIDKNNDDNFKAGLINHMINSYRLIYELNLDMENNDDVVKLSKIISLCIKSESHNEFITNIENSSVSLNDHEKAELASFSKRLYREIDELIKIKKQSFSDLETKSSEEQFKKIDDFIGAAINKYYKNKGGARDLKK